MHTNTETKFIKAALTLSIISVISGCAALIYEMIFMPEYKSTVDIPPLPYSTFIYSITILAIVAVCLTLNKSCKSKNHFIACVISAIIIIIFTYYFDGYDTVRINTILNDWNLSERNLYFLIFRYIMSGEIFLTKCSLIFLAIASGIISSKDHSEITNSVKEN